jgi:hypothetical protein
MGKEIEERQRELISNFERYMIALHCEEPDRVPQGDRHVDQRPKESFSTAKVTARRSWTT